MVKSKKAIFFDRDGNLIDLSDKLPIGWLWNHMSGLTGFGTLGASKLMGKVGYGKFSRYYYSMFEIILDGPITEKKQEHFKMIDIDTHGVDDLAYTLQKFTLDKIKEIVYPLKTCDNLCVAGGVAFGIALGVGKIVFGFDLATVLMPLYFVAVILTYFSTEEFVNVAWDSAGVTTGPVTVLNGVLSLLEEMVELVEVQVAVQIPVKEMEEAMD